TRNARGPRAGSRITPTIVRAGQEIGFGARPWGVFASTRINYRLKPGDLSPNRQAWPWWRTISSPLSNRKDHVTLLRWPDGVRGTRRRHARLVQRSSFLSSGFPGRPVPSSTWCHCRSHTSLSLSPQRPVAQPSGKYGPGLHAQGQGASSYICNIYVTRLRLG